MGRKKIEIRPIPDDRNRGVTFNKRKTGLLKKAYELSVLCRADVAVIVFGGTQRSKMYTYCNSDIKQMIERTSHYIDMNMTREDITNATFEKKNGKDDDDESEEEEDHTPPRDHRASLSQQPQPQPHLQHGFQPVQQQQQQQQQQQSQQPGHQPIMTNGSYQNQQHPPAPGHRHSMSRDTMPRAPPAGHPPHPHPAISGPQTAPNGYAYVRDAPVYNQQAGVGMPVGPRHEHDQHQNYAYNQQPASSQPYIDDRRPSMPNAVTSYSRGSDNEGEVRRPSLPPVDTRQEMLEDEPAMKEKSIFTPIAANTSVLAAHWGASAVTPDVKTAAESKTQPDDKTFSPPQRRPSPRQLPRISSGEPVHQTAYAPPEEMRVDQSPKSAKPRLKVHIPSEQSDAGSVTGETTPQNSGAPNGAQSAKSTTDGSHSSGVVLPPPSPSAAILSAGAQGPHNPFARPHAPASAVPIDTPLSGLPSRYIDSAMLPSPSSFFGGHEWMNHRHGDMNNILPSPLGFQPTPTAGTSNNSFMSGSGGGTAEPDTNKRRSPPSGEEMDTEPKRAKVGPA